MIPLLGRRTVETVRIRSYCRSCRPDADCDGRIGRFAAHRREPFGHGVRVSGNTLTLSASSAGLGNVPSARFDLEGTVSVSSRCYTRSGNKPQAANKQESITVDQTKD